MTRASGAPSPVTFIMDTQYRVKKRVQWPAPAEPAGFMTGASPIRPINKKSPGRFRPGL